MLIKVLMSAAAILTAINVVITVVNVRVRLSNVRILEAIRAIEARRAEPGVGAIFWEPSKGESRKTLSGFDERKDFQNENCRH